MRRGREFQIAVGEVVEVIQEDDRAVFCRLELRHYQSEDGTPLEALARLLVPYHGAGFGDWHLPDVGADVVCAFPGLSFDGMPGGDLDEGYILGFVSTIPEPPVKTGVGGDLSATRRVYRGKSGVAHDVRIQGALDQKIDGAENSENVGAVERVFRAAARWVGDAALSLVSSTVELGGGTLQKLLNKAAMDLYNQHTHDSQTGLPVQQMIEDTHTTTDTTAS